jgi:hypothetical protein
MLLVSPQQTDLEKAIDMEFFAVSRVPDHLFSHSSGMKRTIIGTISSHPTYHQEKPIILPSSYIEDQSKAIMPKLGSPPPMQEATPELTTRRSTLEYLQMSWQSQRNGKKDSQMEG